MSRQPVVLVGVPIEGVGSLDIRAQAAIAEATLLCGARRHLEEVPSHGEERLEIGDVERTVARLRDRGPDERATVLATGDPLLFGIGATLVGELGRDEVSVIPATSSVQEAFARARVAWHDARILSAHGRELAPVVPAALDTRVAAILCGPDTPPQRVAQALLDGGMEDCRAVVCQRLGGPVERVVDSSLGAIAAMDLDPFSVVVLERESGSSPDRLGAPQFGRPEADFSHRDGMITRAEVRAVVLSRLHPAGASVIWDVGAGSGSIGIEAGCLHPGARVYAVERDDEQLEHLRRNASAMLPGQVEVVAGTAPEALAGLPDPDRVIVGGHGGRLGEILGVIRSRLRGGGRVVCSLATLDGVIIARTALGDWNPEVAQVSIARGVPAGRSLRFAAEDPVYVVSATATQ